jgi:hypothetical protein
MSKQKQQDDYDKALEDSFPASDPPSTSGITGTRRDRDEDARPTGTPTHNRHEIETDFSHEPDTHEAE